MNIILFSAAPLIFVYDGNEFAPESITFNYVIRFLKGFYWIHGNIYFCSTQNYLLVIIIITIIIIIIIIIIAIINDR